MHIQRWIGIHADMCTNKIHNAWMYTYERMLVDMCVVMCVAMWVAMQFQVQKSVKTYIRTWLHEYAQKKCV